MLRIQNIGSFVLISGLVAGCDYSGDFLFPEIVDNVPAVLDLGEIEVASVTTLQEASDAAIYAQVSATASAQEGGVTYNFLGSGADVCVFVDPEFVTWSQSVATQGRTRRWAYPDNLSDDGDLDLSVGLAIYYDGSPGEEIGDFAIRYDDALGNPVAIALNECVIGAPLDASDTGGTSGRGAPEYCTIEDTQPGVSYVVKMSTWSTPIDDDVLGFGILLMEGNCDDLMTEIQIDIDGELETLGRDTARQECLIPGEIIDRELADGPGPWMGASNVPTIEGALEFERAFCEGERMSVVCEDEAEAKDCSVEQCFCGDPTDTPSGGAF